MRHASTCTPLACTPFSEPQAMESSQQEYWCNCSKYCRSSGKNVAVATYNRHKRQRALDAFSPEFVAFLSSRTDTGGEPTLAASTSKRPRLSHQDQDPSTHKRCDKGKQKAHDPNPAGDFAIDAEYQGDFEGTNFDSVSTLFLNSHLSIQHRDSSSRRQWNMVIH